MPRILPGGLHPTLLTGLLTGLATIGSAAPASAEIDAQLAGAQPASPAPAVSADTPGALPDALFAQAPLSEAELAATSGREQSSWMSASSSNNAVVSGNHVGDNNMTGDVNVTDSAFQNVSGISMVNFNTGNNSSINAAMSVNLHITFAPVTP